MEEEGDPPAGQRPLDLVLRGRGASAAAAHSLEEGRARARPGCPAGPLALRSLPSGAAEPELRVPAAGSLPVLPHRSAPRCRQGRAGQGRAGQAPGALAWRSALTGSCSLFLCSRREQQEEEQEGAALALCSAAEPGRCPGARAGGLRLQQAALWAAPGSHLRGGRHAAPAHPGKPAWPGGPQPSLRLLRRGAGCPQQLRARGTGLFTPATRFCSQPRLGARSRSWGSALATAVARQLLRQAPVLLPLPQELLAVLQREGPSTEGIFRRAASATAFRELREALDRRAPVDLGSQPALLLAVILKVSASHLQLRELLQGLECSEAQLEPLPLQDFLRSIPAKLLVSHLYEDWMAAMQKSSKEEKMQELKA